ncbi:MAG: prepilin peptidase, partial [Candidatus Eisenbacteria bacterium]
MERLIAIFLFVVGLVVGSFLNVCIFRLPRNRSIVRPGSSCPSCGERVRPRDNIPVLGWILLAGRCRDCRARISPRYPLVELGAGLLFLLVWSRFPHDWTIVF